MTSSTSKGLVTEKPPLPPKDAGERLLQLADRALAAAAVAFAVQLLIAVASDLHLWTDGVWYLISMATIGHVPYSFHVPYTFSNWCHEFFHSRIGADLAMQAPTLLAIHLGVRSLHALSIIFGFTLYLHAPLSIYVCSRYARERIYLLFPILSLVAGSVNSEVIPVNESNLTVSLYWSVLFILLFSDELKGWTLALLVALSAPIVISYESMALFGIVLGGICVWRLRSSTGGRKVYAGLAGWYLLSAGFAVASIIWPFDPNNRSGFFAGLTILFRSGYLSVHVSAVALVCTAGILAVPPFLTRIRMVAFSVGLAAVAFMMWEVLMAREPARLDTQMMARTLNFIVPLLSTVLLFAVFQNWIRPDVTAVSLATCLLSVLAIGQSFWMIGAALRWAGMLSTLRYEMSLHQGPIPYRQSVMSAHQLGPLRLGQLHGNWSLAALSIYEAENGNVQSIVLPPPDGYLPFNPYSVDDLPDLSMYGIRYDVYRKSLGQRFDLEQTLTFTMRGNARNYLGAGWSDPEDWAIWSGAQDFELLLPVTDVPKRSDILLDVQLVPNLTVNQPHLTAAVIVNGVAVGQWSFDYKPKFEVSSRQARIPMGTFWKMNPVSIHFRINEQVKSPTELGQGLDPRKLGLAFLRLRLSAAE